ncbi:MAG: 16S rRNA (guanine(527)-N(7))-methyltransferase RsmG [Elusimicrobiaceae bacterium]|nr:16S rRNA (guanine(527)-N(7))-methyltransferase RsmG [Elusimicrobiaceae bacterium]
MPKKLLNFAVSIGLPLCESQAQLLADYAALVWQKRERLNLTSAAGIDEILLRHICDGLQGAALVKQLSQNKGLTTFSVIDAGAGAGYIGITLAIALPQAQVTLVESIEKRCAFMNWAILSLGLKNVQVKNIRLGEQKDIQADFVTERAMGQLPDILNICLSAVKPGGVFLAYQGEQPQTQSLQPPGIRLSGETLYHLPADSKNRYLVLFEKE